jgi:hypothetical protein
VGMLATKSRGASGVHFIGPEVGRQAVIDGGGVQSIGFNLRRGSRGGDARCRRGRGGGNMAARFPGCGGCNSRSSAQLVGDVSGAIAEWRRQ